MSSIENISIISFLQKDHSKRHKQCVADFIVVDGEGDRLLG